MAKGEPTAKQIEAAKAFQHPLAEAIRLNEQLIDSETGEILSEHDIGIDSLAMQLKDVQEQIKSWEQAEALLKLAIGRKLDDANVTAAETPFGVAAYQVQNRHNAPFGGIGAVASKYALTGGDLVTLYECGASFDVKKLRALQKRLMSSRRTDRSERLSQAIDDLIVDKIVRYVLLRPLRKSAPVMERVAIE